MNFKSLAQLETEHILLVLRACNNNKVVTAQILGISTKTLYNKLNKLTNKPSSVRVIRRDVEVKSNE